MKKSVLYALILIPPLALTGCKTTGGDRVGDAGPRQIYAAMGSGLLGQNLAALNSADRKKALEAEYRALEYTDSGKIVSWQSDNNQSSGVVTPGQPYQVGTQNCRQYSHSYYVNGVPQTARGSACRNQNGSWTPLT